jgi:hypothetical protein
MLYRTLRGQLLGTLFVLPALVLVSVVPPPAGSSGVVSRRQHGPAIIRERHGRNATSYNWSGYAVTGSNGSVTDVKGSWIVPTNVTCPNGAPDSYSSFWVGIDGFNSNTVEQIGIDADCIGGTPAYSAWFEFYPHWPYTINTITINPGDTIFAEVSAGAKSQFTVTLRNVYRNQVFSTTTKMPQAQLSSAEWVVEAPWSSGVLPLANFGTAWFGHQYTSQNNTCYATVGGNTGAIGSFGANIVQINMVTSTGANEALPSPLGDNGTSFTDARVSSGP